MSERNKTERADDEAQLLDAGKVVLRRSRGALRGGSARWGGRPIARGISRRARSCRRSGCGRGDNGTHGEIRGRAELAVRFAAKQSLAAREPATLRFEA